MYRQLFEMDWELIEAYDADHMSYEDTYRHCFKSARLMVWIIQNQFS